jgi:hypothetical protein
MGSFMIYKVSFGGVPNGGPLTIGGKRELPRDAITA